ncbi:sugar phosphate isomerase/epimerase family protein [Neobacillus sp. PS3-12]|uniref:sugar phosphate isomerase/epimerase family protein n=1 Tax=Neobacillus sp. PS3-12 TaxID=3070677 RepID=UPI0027DFB500|nr:sugar phosphate isomerase/epimerase family protein [Neobacillus sp. PS3-12]WML53522.1 sugar phosphate isomerase/epimerase family protein [Neobacillus sp. PS3-12]
MRKIQMSQISPMNIYYALYPLEYFLDSLVKYDIHAVELWGGSPHVPIEDATFASVCRIRDEIVRRDLNIACFTPETCKYPINIAAEEPSLRDRSIKYLLKSLDIASELGANLMQIVPGTGYFNKKPDEAWKRSRESLQIIIEKADVLGIDLTLEPLLKRESNLIFNKDLAKKMLNEIHSPRLGCNVDTVPMAEAGDSLVDYFTELKVNHIHLCDGPNHVAWGDGTLPLHQYVNELEQFEYQGYLGLEIYNSTYYLDPDQALEQTLNHIRAAIG